MKGEAAAKSGRASVGTRRPYSDVSLPSSRTVKPVPGTTLPIIFLLVCKKNAFLPRSCDSDSAVKYKKIVELSHLW